ncbi:SixA phosphatase family protein [Nitratifractor salsuginis]|uniref:Phosphohistidine phosphatase, SixA n=1 Tax=Nitratifractor salsuginis (strain DSM 16511 / JCM 12458 / E9I37-1) TaxID=749222 RepID=E6WXZ5_NITSE|nr:histidine phosphatase family protein [Nitratifractor salsuginis]ADV46369.1 putative phosphohistidine phosphatase, SixA [Nitratifractor salsuginis DSM 16511]
MSKKLILMRHAKSSWKEPLPDQERPLNKRGKRAAKMIGKTLAEKGIIPDLILSSDAKRARATAKRVLKALDKEKIDLQLDPALYAADAREILREIEKTEDKIQTLMVVAHNPGISELAVMLSGEDAFSWLPTAAVVVLEIDGDSWREIAPGKAKVLLHLIPREWEKS